MKYVQQMLNQSGIGVKNCTKIDFFNSQKYRADPGIGKLGDIIPCKSINFYIFFSSYASCPNSAIMSCTFLKEKTVTDFKWETREKFLT